MIPLPCALIGVYMQQQQCEHMAHTLMNLFFVQFSLQSALTNMLGRGSIESVSAALVCPTEDTDICGTDKKKKRKRKFWDF